MISVLMYGGYRAETVVSWSSSTCNEARPCNRPIIYFRSHHRLVCRRSLASLSKTLSFCKKCAIYHGRVCGLAGDFINVKLIANPTSTIRRHSRKIHRYKSAHIWWKYAKIGLLKQMHWRIFCLVQGKFWKNFAHFSAK